MLDHQEWPQTPLYGHLGVIKITLIETHLLLLGSSIHRHDEQTVMLQIDCYWHVHNHSTKLHKEDCSLGSGLALRAMLACSERSQRQPDHECSKPDPRTREERSERIKLHLGYKEWSRKWGLVYSFRRHGIHLILKFQQCSSFGSSVLYLGEGKDNKDIQVKWTLRFN